MVLQEHVDDILPLENDAGEFGEAAIERLELLGHNLRAVLRLRLLAAQLRAHIWAVNVDDVIAILAEAHVVGLNNFGLDCPPNLHSSTYSSASNKFAALAIDVFDCCSVLLKLRVLVRKLIELRLQLLGPQILRPP